jgi:hypothetical protein
MTTGGRSRSATIYYLCNTSGWWLLLTVCGVAVRVLFAWNSGSIAGGGAQICYVCITHPCANTPCVWPWLHCSQQCV